MLLPVGLRCTYMYQFMHFVTIKYLQDSSYLILDTYTVNFLQPRFKISCGTVVTLFQNRTLCRFEIDIATRMVAKVLPKSHEFEYKLYC